MSSAEGQSAYSRASKRRRTRAGEVGEGSGVKSRYEAFDDENTWEIFKLPNTEVSAEDATARGKLRDSKKLSGAEIVERENWALERDRWTDYEEIKTLSTHEEFLNHRVLAPVLSAAAQHVSRPSSSSDTRQRVFPPQDAVVEWNGFDELVRQFSSSPVTNAKFVDPWYRSFSDLPPLRNEDAEKGWLETYVLWPLHRARLLDCAPETASTQGKPDLCLFCNHNGSQSAIACVETKATHNLWLPSEAEDIIANYKKCWLESSRALNSCISHPIGQLARTMIVNKVMYGAISSATRTYFVRFDRKDSKIYMLISRRWYVGEQHYLRAWAWFSNCARCAHENEFPETELRKWNGNSPRCISKRSNSRLAQNVRRAEHLVNVTRVEWEDFVFSGDVLGDGRHGSVREAVWCGTRVAVKTFDLDHGAGNSFKHELDAYISLTKFQSLLVPKLLFWSRHWTGSLFALGLQIGRMEPKDSRRDIFEEKEILLENLRQCGYVHGDSEDLRNFIYIDNGECEERLVAIDLECMEPFQPSPSSTQLSEDDSAESAHISIHAGTSSKKF